MGEYGSIFSDAVAAELRAQRARVRVTFDELSERTGLAKSTVINYLNGNRDIPMTSFADICKVLGASPRDIFLASERSIELALADIPRGDYTLAARDDDDDLEAAAQTSEP